MAATTPPLYPTYPTRFNQSDKLSTAHAMHKDTGFLPSIPNQKVKSCCLDSQPQAGPQQQSADEPICIRKSSFKQDHSCWQALMKASSHILADVLGSILSPTALLVLFLHARNSWNTSRTPVTKMQQLHFVNNPKHIWFFLPNGDRFLWALKSLRLKWSQQ